MTNPVSLILDGAEVGDNLEWELSFEEILGGPGRAILTIQDRTNAVASPATHADVKAVIASSDWVLYRGEVLTPKVELPVGFAWRRWQLDCTDYNAQLAQRLVGAVDGTAWQDDGFGNFSPIDPFASTLATDRVTLQALFDHYFRVRTDAAETDTYVGEYLAPGSFVPIFWLYSTLRRATDDLAALVAVNIQDWLDPDLFLHHVAIPAWADLAGVLAGSGPGLPLLFPTAVSALLPVAPREITDVISDPSAQIGCRDLTFTLDGAVQPEQVYVKGATGFTYDTGAPPTGVPAVPVPTPVRGTSAPAGTYLLTVTATMNIYWLDPDGYIHVGHSTTPPGGPYYVTPKTVPTRPTPPYMGGNFWLLTSGPAAGFLIHQRSNVLGYGTMTVSTIAEPPGPAPDPVIGIGGSGWVGGVGDPTLRQAYIEAPTSTTQSDRDAIGGQALYRGATPTLRGSLVIGGDHRAADGTLYPTVDGWRAGQVVKITDARLPDELNGRFFMIQRVATTLISGRDAREYTIDWGDGAVQRLSTSREPKVPVPSPATKLYVVWNDASPAPDSVQVVWAELVSTDGRPWSIANRTINWTLVAVDASYTVVPGQGTLDPPSSQTDANGKARTTFTAGSMLGLQYFVYVDTPAI